MKDAVSAGIIWADVPVYLVGVVVAAGVGYACIRLLKMIAEKGKFGFFAYYCWAARRGNADFDPAAELSIGGTYCGFLITKEIHFREKARKFQRFPK